MNLDKDATEFNFISGYQWSKKSFKLSYLVSRFIHDEKKITQRAEMKAKKKKHDDYDSLMKLFEKMDQEGYQCKGIDCFEQSLRAYSQYY